MEIYLLKHPGAHEWLMCRNAALITVGKAGMDEPSLRQKCALLDAEHSPIRLLHFVFQLEDVPYYVAMHLVRHHVGCTPFVKSQRNDRQSEYDRNAARQDAPVNMLWELNAQSLIDVAHKRLCGLADPSTREVVRRMCEEVVKVNPEFKWFLVPECDYRGGVCHEIRGCGYRPHAGRPWEDE